MKQKMEVDLCWFDSWASGHCHLQPTGSDLVQKASLTWYDLMFVCTLPTSSGDGSHFCGT